MKISVIIPVYDRAAWIGQTLESLLNQKTGALQVLCVDDGSRDQSAAVIRRFAQAAAGRLDLRLISLVHAGVSAARNEGLRRATGEYVAFLDSDDLWVPGFLNDDVLDLLAREHPDLMGFGYTVVDEQLQPYDRYNARLPDFARRCDLQGGVAAVKRGQRHFCAFLYRREFLQKGNHRFRSGLQCNEDVLFLNRCLYESQKVLYEPRTLFLHRKHPGSLSTWRLTPEGRENLLSGWQAEKAYFAQQYPRDRAMLSLYEGRIRDIEQGINL